MCVATLTCVQHGLNPKYSQQETELEDKVEQFEIDIKNTQTKLIFLERQRGEFPVLSIATVHNSIGK